MPSRSLSWHSHLPLVVHAQRFASLQPQPDGPDPALELLVRWVTPGSRIMPPGAFVPAAEVSGHISRLDEWMVRRAVAEADRAPRPVTVTVNMSTVTLQQRHIDPARWAVPSGRGQVVVEVTETGPVTDPALLAARVADLKAAGFGVALDDIAVDTSTTTLYLLDRVDVDMVKFDQSVTRAVTCRPLPGPVRAIVDRMAATGRRSVAEHVTDVAELAAVTDVGFSHAQGNLIGPARPVSDVMHDIAQETWTLPPAPVLHPR